MRDRSLSRGSPRIASELQQASLPSASTIQRIAMLDLNIAAIGNTLADEKS